jgi:chromosome segregation ATPase
MGQPIKSDLSEAEARLEGLEHERADIQNRFGEAVKEGDVVFIFKLEPRLGEIEVELFAGRARVLKLRRGEAERRRAEAVTERDALEVASTEATKQYAASIAVADECRIAMQTVQAKLFSLDMRAEQARQDANSLTDELKTLVNSRISRRDEGLEAKVRSIS